jgi:hypothetical protein
MCKPAKTPTNISGQNSAQSISDPELSGDRKPTACRSEALASCRERAPAPSKLSRRKTRRDDGHTRKAPAITQAGLGKRPSAPRVKTTRSANTSLTPSFPPSRGRGPRFSAAALRAVVIGLARLSLSNAQHPLLRSFAAAFAVDLMSRFDLFGPEIVREKSSEVEE